MKIFTYTILSKLFLSSEHKFVLYKYNFFDDLRFSV